MKDDNSPSAFYYQSIVYRDMNLPYSCPILVSAYGIRVNSKIAVIGGDQVPTGKSGASEKAKVPERKTEELALSQIRTEVDKVRTTLTPEVDTFLSTLPTASSPAADSPVNASLSTGQEQEHVRLGEILLQSLLRLDAIITEGEWLDARKERKGAVKEVQSLLDRLDGAWKKAKAFVAAGSKA